MSSENNLYSPLLERLKALQESQQQWRTISNDLLSNIKSPLNIQQKFDLLNPKNSPEKTPDAEKNRDILKNKEFPGMLEKSQHDFSSTIEKIDKMNVENYLNPINKDFRNIGEMEDQNMHQEIIPKFSYLKKGKGSAKYNQKKLKGFKKMEPKVKHRKIDRNLKVKEKQQQEPLKLPTSDIQSALEQMNVNQEQSNLETRPIRKESNFEKLEELIERDSFCSTSSKVIELLHDESSGISTPVASRISFIGTLESTPIRQKYSSENLPIGKRSPTRKLFPTSFQSSLNSGSPFPIEVVKFLPNKSEPLTMGTLVSETKGEWPVTKDSALGILKKNEYSATTSTLKVKFLEQGVKVLEYDKDDKDDSLATSSNDTDLISVSDLENLALLNYNVNVIYENTLSDDESPRKIVLDNKSLNNIIDFHSSDAKLESCFQTTLKEESLDVKAHKALLLSKVHDLNKEIGIFENKNKTMEQLISELQNEKQKLLENQKQNLDNNTKAKSFVKPKKKFINNISSGQDEIYLQVQELTKKLQILEIENSKLRVKVIGLEKKQREINKKQNLKITGTDSLRNNCSKNANVAPNIKGKIPKPYVRSRVPILRTKIKEIAENISPKSNEFSEDKTVKNLGAINAKSQLTELHVPNLIGTPKNSAEEKETILQSILNLNKFSDNDEADIGEIRHSLSTICEENVEEQSNSQLFLGNLSSRNINEKGRSQTPMESGKLLSPQNDENSIEIIDIPCKTVSSSEIQKLDDENSVYYDNGDIQIIYLDRVVYHYAKNNTTHTRFKDNSREEIQFTNGQKEIYYKDSSYQLIFPDSSSKSVYKDGSEICVWEDGTVVRTDQSGIKCVHFPNGQKEVHELDYVRRIYPDGTTKVLYSDGRQETRYKSGKVRVKDPNGNVTMYKKS